MTHTYRRPRRRQPKYRQDGNCDLHHGARIHRSYESAAQSSAAVDQPVWCPESGGYHTSEFGRDGWRLDCQDTA